MPSNTPTAAPSPSPGSTPASACPTQTGGSSGNRALLPAVRLAHHDGYDRLVFEFHPSRGPGAHGAPPRTLALPTLPQGPGRQAVTIARSAIIRVRFDNTEAHDQSGKQTVAKTDIRSTDVTPNTTVVKQVKIVEDFEATNVWGVGLDHLVCPSVLTLGGPVRVVLDFATP